MMQPNFPRHGCGGELRPIGITSTRNVDGFVFITYGVPGRRCSQCGTEVLSRETALALETKEVASYRYLVHEAHDPERGVSYTANTPTVYRDSSAGVRDSTVLVA